MGYGYKHGGSGTSPLNFKVVGGTAAPSAPRENTIWIETNTNVTSWIFSAVEPSAPSEGMVWISTGTSSPVEFNSLKKNALMVYPGSVMYYNGTEWENVDAYIYQNGAWVRFSLAWNGYYFDNGEQHSSITGGWTSKGYKYYDYSMKTGTVGATLRTGSSGNYTASMVGTAKRVDLTNVDTIHIKVEAEYGGSSFAVMKTKELTAGDLLVGISVGEKKVNVSRLTGSYYLAIASAGGQTYPNTYATVSAIWGNNASSGGGEPGIALLSLDNDPSDDAVFMDVDGMEYGINNATMNEEPSPTSYDFTVL